LPIGCDELGQQRRQGERGEGISASHCHDRGLYEARLLAKQTFEYVIENFRTDLYFPVGDARFEAQFISRVSLVPIPSLWGHPAGAGGNPADRAFLNEAIGRFLAGESVGR